MRTVDGTAAQLTSPDTRIARSWARCARAYHLAPQHQCAPTVIAAGDLRERVQRHDELIGVASAEIDLLYEQIAGSGYALLLTDESGIILCQRVDPTLGRLFRGAGLLPGADWSERSEGTNGIGTCLAELRSVTVHRDEHFKSNHIGLSCSGALIRDPLDQVVAVLDASTVGAHDTRASQAHTMALVNLSALAIEKCLFMQRHRRHLVLRFHWRPEFVNLVNDGAIALDADGIVVAADRSALALLGVRSRAELVGHDIEQLLSVRLDHLKSSSCHADATLWSARAHGDGHRYYVMVQPSASSRPFRQLIGFSRSTAPAAGQRSDADGEYARVVGVIERCRWNMSRAAAELKLSRSTLYRRLRQLGIPKPHPRRS
ncbi:MAG TPA: helix-turn-helix domain-containing protein [Steroidobacteraceae bacterium]